MKKIIGFLCICVLSYCTCIMNVAAAETIPQEVRCIAADAYETAKKKIESHPKQYNLKGLRDCQITLGEGYEIRYVDGDILSKRQNLSAKDLIDSDMIRNWRFTVDVNGIPKTYITVGIENGAYKLIGYGDTTDAYSIARKQAEVMEESTGIEKELFQFGGKFYFVVGENVIPVENSATEGVVGSASTWSMKNEEAYMHVDEWIDGMLKEQSTYIQGERSGISEEVSTQNSLRNKVLVLILCVSVVGGIVIWLQRKRG